MDYGTGPEGHTLAPVTCCNARPIGLRSRIESDCGEFIIADPYCPGNATILSTVHVNNKLLFHAREYDD